MGLVLRVQVLKGRNLAAKDKSGTSDPYLVLTLGDAKQATSVASKTLNPEWNQTFEFPVLSADSALFEAVCWDKDRFKKDYMGEFDVVLEDLFLNGSTMPESKWVQLESRRAGKKRKKKKDTDVSGEVLLKFTLYDALNTAANAQQILQKFTGIVAGLDDDDEDEDEYLSRFTSRGLDDVSEEDDDDDENENENEDDKEPSDEADDGMKTPLSTPDEKARRRRQKKIAKLRRKNKLRAYEFSGMSDVAGVLFLEINRITDLPPEKNSTRTTFDMDPFVVTSLGKKTYRTRVVNHNLNPVYDEKLVFQVQNHETQYSLSFAVVDRDKFSGNDFVGTAIFPVDKVKNLAPVSDPETGLYKLPDPEAQPEGQPPAAEKRKRFRMPLSRTSSSANVNISRNSSSQNLNRLTRTTSSNSLRGEQPDGSHQMAAMKRLESDNDLHDQIVAHNAQSRPAPTSNPSYAPSMPSAQNGSTDSQSDDPDLFAYEIPLELKNKQRWQDKHNPVLYIRAKYLPYRALRQQFWRAMLRQYDADESGKIDKVELITMLDTLGSTLHNSTIDGFFARWKAENVSNGVASADRRVLTMDQAVICLEEQLMKSRETQGKMHMPRWHRHNSAASTESVGNGHKAQSVPSSSPDESPGGGTPKLVAVDSNNRPARAFDSLPSNLNPNSTSIPALEVSDVSENGGRGGPDPKDASAYSPIALGRADSWGAESETDLNDDPETKEEHVVEIQECPICHMPRLSGKGKHNRRAATDADIITHIATCASSDWRAVNNLVMAGFVSSSQARRKWYVHTPQGRRSTSKTSIRIACGGEVLMESQVLQSRVKDRLWRLSVGRQ